jgi:hypothetical protein
MILTISKEGKIFTVEDKSLPGSPPVGRGRTMKEAMGDWLHNNQRRLNLTFDVHTSAQRAENARRIRELAKR